MGQTVQLPAMETEALDQETNSHTGTVAEKTVINDLVNYSNLISGEEYTIRGNSW
ncbi:MAG: VaFE repeat-containing surface-anchored protein [Eisenbergiella sp.]